MKKNVSLLLLSAFLATNGAFAAGNFQYQPAVPQPVPTYVPQERVNYGSQPLKGRVVTVPAGMSMPAVVSTPISSANLTLGQQVAITLGSDYYYNNNLIAQAGSSVQGTVVQVSKAKHGSMNGKLQLRFTQITTPYGLQIPISAIIKTDDNTGILIGGTKMDVTKNYAKDIAIGSAAGALAGVAISAMSGGSLGKGTALATGLGATLGLGKSAIDKGVDVEIPAGATIELMFTQPITVNPSGSYNY